MKVKRQSLELSTVQPENQPAESDEPICCRNIPIQPAVRPMFHVIDVASGSVPDMRAGYYSPGNDILRPGSDRILKLS